MARRNVYEDSLVQMGKPRSFWARNGGAVVGWGAVLLILALVAVNTWFAVVNRNLNSELAERVAVQYNPSYKVRYADLGGRVVQSYFASEAPPVVLADGVDWPNVGSPKVRLEVVPTQSATEGSNSSIADSLGRLEVSAPTFVSGQQVARINSAQYREVLNYYVVVNGLPFTATVTLGIADLNDFVTPPTLLSSPVLLPFGAPEDSSLTGEPRGEFDSWGATDAAESVVSQWAEAYTTNDVEVLKQLTQDSSERNYTGLVGGWSYVENSATVEWGALRDANNAVVEIAWQMRLPGVTIQGEGSTDEVEGQVVQQRMNLMLQGIDSNLPSVVAWGPPGTYSTLVPYTNGTLEDVTVNAPSTVNPTILAPTATSGTESEAGEPTEAEVAEPTEAEAVEVEAPVTEENATNEASEGSN